MSIHDPFFHQSVILSKSIFLRVTLISGVWSSLHESKSANKEEGVVRVVGAEGTTGSHQSGVLQKTKVLSVYAISCLCTYYRLYISVQEVLPFILSDAISLFFRRTMDLSIISLHLSLSLSIHHPHPYPHSISISIFISETQVLISYYWEREVETPCSSCLQATRKENWLIV